MPLVRISTRSAPSPDFARQVGQRVHRAMMETINVPEGDRFQLIAGHDDVVYDPSYLGIQRTDGIVVIQITLAAGRTSEMKAALYRRIAELLSSELNVRPEDVFIALVEVPAVNFSFGRGEAQYLGQLPPHLRALRAEPADSPR
jgi:phenylpyruvate tautomerase PptA (4-oxalocrotonate tautomerase family)